MRSDFTGQRPNHPAVVRLALVPLALAAALGLGACTTTEGTNALTDFTTFEREVMTSTLQGVGIIDREVKEDTGQRRAPLVMPKDGTTLPPPQEDTLVAALPKDSSTAQIDSTGLTDEDIRRLRNARVVDLTTMSGRPLTEEEARQLTARMTAARLSPGPRPLYLPPAEYFTTVDGQDLVCMSAKGELVPVTHRDCPYQIKEAIGRSRPQGSQALDIRNAPGM